MNDRSCKDKSGMFFTTISWLSLSAIEKRMPAVITLLI